MKLRLVSALSISVSAINSHALFSLLCLICTSANLKLETELSIQTADAHLSWSVMAKINFESVTGAVKLVSPLPSPSARWIISCGPHIWNVWTRSHSNRHEIWYKILILCGRRISGNFSWISRPYVLRFPTKLLGEEILFSKGARKQPCSGAWCRGDILCWLVCRIKMIIRGLRCEWEGLDCIVWLGSWRIRAFSVDAVDASSITRTEAHVRMFISTHKWISPRMIYHRWKLMFYYGYSNIL